MQKKSLWIVMLSFVVLALAGWVFASGHGGSLGLHGGAGHHVAMMRLIGELDLTDEQEQYLENIHEIIFAQREQRVEQHSRGLQWMLDHLEQGSLDTIDIREKIDLHAEEFRHVGYQIGDELIVLFNSLDDEQRDILAAHLRKVSEGDHGKWLRPHLHF